MMIMVMMMHDDDDNEWLLWFGSLAKGVQVYSSSREHCERDPHHVLMFF